MTEEGFPSYRAPRSARPVLAGSCIHRFPGLFTARKKMDDLRISHLDVAHKFLAADAGHLYMPDLLMMAMMQRSYGLVDALIDSVDAYNLVAAAPLVRLQIDTLVRASYVARCSDADEVIQKVLSGVQFRKLKDDDGKALTDAYLMMLAEPHHGWAKVVYQKTSGWVHLSANHILATWQVDSEGDPGRLRGGLPLRPDVIPESLWAELLGAMTQATEEIFEYAEMWTSRKGLPPGVTRPTH